MRSCIALHRISYRLTLSLQFGDDGNTLDAIVLVNGRPTKLAEKKSKSRGTGRFTMMDEQEPITIVDVYTHVPEVQPRPRSAKASTATVKTSAILPQRTAAAVAAPPAAPPKQAVPSATTSPNPLVSSARGKSPRRIPAETSARSRERVPDPAAPAPTPAFRSPALKPEPIHTALDASSGPSLPSPQSSRNAPIVKDSLVR